MREITARAWYEKSQSWVYFTLGQGFTDEGLEVYREVCLSGTKWYQYTGLKDTHDKEIFEGDILENEYGRRASVKWDFASLAALQKQSHRATIIGNIYETPELLESKV